MPSGTVSLTVVGPGSTPAGPTHDEQQSTAAGNSFENDGSTLLIVRNTNASSRVITFVADRYGAEQTVITSTIPGSGTENGTKVLGPFPPEAFNDHGTTDSAKNGHAMFTHSGSNSDLMLCPTKINRSLLKS